MKIRGDERKNMGHKRCDMNRRMGERAHDETEDERWTNGNNKKRETKDAT